jgi:DNA polymerase-3 subunit beta
VKLSVSRPALVAALKTVTKALPRNYGLPALSGVRVEAADAHVQLTCSDLDLTISTYIDAQIDEPGTALIPGKLFDNIVAKLSGDQVQLGVVDDVNVIIGAGRTVAQLRAINLTEWPKLAEPGEPVATLGTRQLHDLERLIPFASIDMGRPILTGIHFAGTTITATDSYRVAICDWGIELPEPALVPSAAIRAMLGADVDDLELSVTPTHVGFRAPTVSWTIRQIDGDYPKTSGFMRERSAHKVTFPTGPTTEALSRLRLIDGDTARPVRIAVDGGVAQLTRASQDVGEISDTVDVEGELPIQVGVNVDYLAELLAITDADEVTLQINDGLKPIQVTHGNVTAAIMPIRVH